MILKVNREDNARSMCSQAQLRYDSAEGSVELSDDRAESERRQRFR